MLQSRYGVALRGKNCGMPQKFHGESDDAVPEKAVSGSAYPKN
jgi:hypothetical protein